MSFNEQQIAAMVQQAISSALAGGLDPSPKGTATTTKARRRKAKPVIKPRSGFKKQVVTGLGKDQWGNQKHLQAGEAIKTTLDGNKLTIEATLPTDKDGVVQLRSSDREGKSVWLFSTGMNSVIDLKLDNAEYRLDGKEMTESAVADSIRFDLKAFAVKRHMK